MSTQQFFGWLRVLVIFCLTLVLLSLSMFLVAHALEPYTCKSSLVTDLGACPDSRQDMTVVLGKVVCKCR